MSQEILFTLFKQSIESYSLPDKFTYPFEYEPHPLCLLAVEELQKHIRTQKDWVHNFGLEDGKKGKIVGKMFGVLLVQNNDGKIGYLAAFSGSLAGKNQQPHFVPSLHDIMDKDGFVTEGMLRITDYCNKVNELALHKADNHQEIIALKKERKAFSEALSLKIYHQFKFLNYKGEQKSLYAIFEPTKHKNPPGGAGECAAPKLLQYAYLNDLKPLALAEFWWGQSPKTEHWKHKHFYPVCLHKCQPILTHMLEGLDVEEKPVFRI